MQTFARHRVYLIAVCLLALVVASTLYALGLGLRANTIAPTAELQPAPSIQKTSNLSMIYAETDGLAGKTTLWQTDPADLSIRHALANVEHKPGYGIRGQVSPDGRQIAFVTIMPDISDSEARATGGELWTMNLDGNNLHKIATRISTLVDWTPDSTALVFQASIAPPPGSSPAILPATQFYSIKPDGSGRQLLVSDNSSLWVQPVGFVRNGATFHYALVTPEKQWQLWNVDLAGSTRSLQLRFPAGYNIQDIALTPDRAQLSLRLVQAGGFDLVTLGLDGQNLHTLYHGKGGNRAIDQSAVLPSPDGATLVTHVPPQANQPAHLELANLQSGQHNVLQLQLKTPLANDEFFVPRAWSPDSHWLVLARYPAIDSRISLVPAQGGTPQQIPAARPENWINVIGWLAQ